MTGKTDRIVTAFLAVLMTLSAASCGASPASPTDGTTAAEGTATEAPKVEFDPFEGLPKKDYGGKEFRIQLRPHERWIGDMYVEEATGDVVDDAIFERNSAVADYFNIKFVKIESSNSNSDSDARAPILAGDDAFELVVPHGCKGAGDYSNEGLMLNWFTDLPYVKLDQPWWDQDCQKSLSINNKLYCMEGDISYCALGAADVMLFNKDVFDELRLDYPYKKVLDGKWTLEEWSKMVRDAGRDLNGDSKFNIDDDFFGYVTQMYIGPVEVFTSCGLRTMSKDKDDIPYLTMNTERTLDVFTRFFDLLDSDDCFCDSQGVSYAAGYVNTFLEGRALFCDMNLADVETMRAMDAEFGIVPWPKYNEQEDYLTNVDAGTNIFCVPITVSDPEMVSMVIEALAAYGYNKVLPAFYEITLMGKTSRDNESAEMLDIIKNSRVYDIGYWNSKLGGVFYTHFHPFLKDDMAGNRDFASWYAKNEPAVQAERDKIIAMDAYKD